MEHLDGTADFPSICGVVIEENSLLEIDWCCMDIGVSSPEYHDLDNLKLSDMVEAMKRLDNRWRRQIHPPDTQDGCKITYPYLLVKLAEMKPTNKTFKEILVLFPATFVNAGPRNSVTETPMLKQSAYVVWSFTLKLSCKVSPSPGWWSVPPSPRPPIKILGRILISLSFPLKDRAAVLTKSLPHGTGVSPLL